jgi:hypothetical protein
VVSDRNARWSWTTAILALAWHAVNGLVAALMGAFPATLDELQHLSFVRAMAATPQLLPRYQDLRVLDPTGGHFTGAVNYLNHPAPYYLVMGQVDRLLGGSVLGLRIANLGLSLAAVALLLAAGFRVLKGWRERAVLAAVLVLFPKLGVVAGLINNDNAALLATGVAFFGLIEWQRRPMARSALLLAFGLALCGWAKLTALIMVGAGALIAEALRLRSGGKRPDLGAYAIVAAGCGLAALPSLANLAAYGRLLHHSNAFYAPPAQRVALTLPHYAAVFLGEMAGKWPALEPGLAVQKLGLVVVLALAAIAMVFTVRGAGDAAAQSDEGAAWRTACGLIAATVPTVLFHFYFGWRTFLEDGFAEMAQPRYYYGVWPGFALGLALLWARAPAGRARGVAAAIVGLLLASSSLAVLGLAALVHGQTRIG